MICCTSSFVFILLITETNRIQKFLFRRERSKFNFFMFFFRPKLTLKSKSDLMLSKLLYAAYEKISLSIGLLILPICLIAFLFFDFVLFSDCDCVFVTCWKIKIWNEMKKWQTKTFKKRKARVINERILFKKFSFCLLF